jgi:hypothetical protein
METKYGVEAGRTITRDGVPFVGLLSCKNGKTGSANFPYVDADDFAHEIVRMANSYAALLAALEHVLSIPLESSLAPADWKIVCAEAQTALARARRDGGV